MDKNSITSLEQYLGKEDSLNMINRLNLGYDKRSGEFSADYVIRYVLSELGKVYKKGRDDAAGTNVTLDNGVYKPKQEFEATLLNDGIKVAERNNKADGGGFDLSGKDLKGLNLSGLKITSLNGATVDSGTNLSRCDLTGCDMTGLNSV